MTIDRSICLALSFCLAVYLATCVRLFLPRSLHLSLTRPIGVRFVISSFFFSCGVFFLFSVFAAGHLLLLLVVFSIKIFSFSSDFFSRADALLLRFLPALLFFVSLKVTACPGRKNLCLRGYTRFSVSLRSLSFFSCPLYLSHALRLLLAPFLRWRCPPLQLSQRQPGLRGVEMHAHASTCVPIQRVTCRRVYVTV